MGVWIALGIVLLLFVLLQLSITLYLQWGEEVLVQVGIAGYRHTVYPKPPKKKKKSEKEKPEKPKEKTDWKEQLKRVVSNGEEQSFGEFIESLLTLLSDLLRPIKKIIQAIRIEDLHYTAWIGSEDAHKTAMLYAGWSAGFYQVLAVLRQTIKVQCKEVGFYADFTSEKVRQQGRMKVKLRLSVLLWQVLCLLVQGIKIAMRATTKTKEETKQTTKTSG